MHTTTFTKFGSAFAATAMLVSLAPATAQAANFRQNPNSGITKIWNQNPTKYGQPISNEKCYENKTCAQNFENATITWNRTNGVKVLNGAENAVAFNAARGAEIFGGFESDAFNNSFCGLSVTTYNGKTRSMIVLTGEHAGRSIDLNSEEAKRWKAERNQTKECFDASPVVEENPAVSVDWSKANYSRTQNALIGTDTNTGITYVVAADAATKQLLPGAPVYKTEWLGEALKYSERAGYNDYSYWAGDSGCYNDYETGEEICHTTFYSSLGMPVADSARDSDTITQQFEGGTLKFSIDREHQVAGADYTLNANGAKKFFQEAYLAYFEMKPTSEYRQLAEGIYGQSFSNGSYSYGLVYSAKTGKVANMWPAAYTYYSANAAKYGPVMTNSAEGSAYTTFENYMLEQSNGAVYERTYKAETGEIGPRILVAPAG